jgi:hypothetical protein
MRALHELVVSGDTRPARVVLRARGWIYDSASCSWIMRLVADHADRVLAGDREFLRGLGGCKPGCVITLDGREVWRSRSYGVAIAAPQRGVGPDPEGWGLDSRGYRVETRPIPGSSPDDRI